MSVPNTRRRSTVHDFASLRLHPDGTRVPIVSPKKISLHNFRERNTGRDARGNRVARNAAGRGVVPKRVVMPEDDGGEEISLGLDMSNGKTKHRSKRRRRLDGDVEFLRDSGNVTARGGTTDVAGEMSWPVPSSDLLKCVHYFASQYYAAKGLLSNQSRIYRCERKQYKAKDKAKDSRVVDADADADADDLFAESDEDDENDGRREEYHEEEPAKSGQRRGSDKKRASVGRVPDMYKAFDGSALMAIGMLLQEHVSTLLTPTSPRGGKRKWRLLALFRRMKVLNRITKGQRMPKVTSQKKRMKKSGPRLTLMKRPNKNPRQHEVHDL
ncbi:hypothetical protein B0F90DRAFT_158422 [Multifurca ochricompacta]|uniref:Uncharacterized protein n=1 Tax=Multifurca ochricompacta TaxID=376703 RepID=A0AAD4QUC0_9AGAM|nr:hypothetical protein B0F90DRAFT_158422 [Multifurca ochricompacta]